MKPTNTLNAKLTSSIPLTLLGLLLTVETVQAQTQSNQPTSTFRTISREEGGLNNPVNNLQDLPIDQPSLPFSPNRISAPTANPSLIQPFNSSLNPTPDSLTTPNPQLESQIQQQVPKVLTGNLETSIDSVENSIPNAISSVSNSISSVWDSALSFIEEIKGEIDQTLKSFLGSLKVPDLKEAVESIMKGSSDGNKGAKLSAALENKPNGSYSLREDLADQAQQQTSINEASNATLSKSAQEKQIQMKEIVEQNAEQTNQLSAISAQLGEDSENQDITQNIMRNISQQTAVAAQQTALVTENQSALIMQNQQAQIDRALANVLSAQQAKELSELNITHRQESAAASTASATQAGLMQMPGGITLGRDNEGSEIVSEK